MKSFEEYFGTLKIKIDGEDLQKAINAKLIQAVRNSRLKGYHTDDLDAAKAIKLPSLPD